MEVFPTAQVVQAPYPPSTPDPIRCANGATTGWIKGNQKCHLYGHYQLLRSLIVFLSSLCQKNNILSLSHCAGPSSRTLEFTAFLFGLKKICHRPLSHQASEQGSSKTESTFSAVVWPTNYISIVYHSLTKLLWFLCSVVHLWTVLCLHGTLSPLICLNPNTFRSICCHCWHFPPENIINTNSASAFYSVISSIRERFTTL